MIRFPADLLATSKITPLVHTPRITLFLFIQLFILCVVNIIMFLGTNTRARLAEETLPAVDRSRA